MYIPIHWLKGQQQVYVFYDVDKQNEQNNKQNKTKQNRENYKYEHYEPAKYPGIRKQIRNKTSVPLETTSDKDEPNIVICGNRSGTNTEQGT
jgi:hypothetical protein